VPVNALRNRAWLGTAAFTRALLGVCLAVLSISPARAQDTAGLRLFLEPSKREFVVGEPLFATMRLRNVGTVPLNVTDNLHVRTEAVSIVAELEQGTGQARSAARYRPLSLLFAPASYRSLAPGEENTFVGAIFFGGTGWFVVDREGDYRLHARYRSPVRSGRGVVEASSEPVRVSVRRGSGAGRFLIDRDHRGEGARFLFWQRGDHLDRGIAHLRQVQTRFPESVLADYVRVAFAKSYSRPFKNYAIDELRPIDCPQALVELSGLRVRLLPAVLNVQSSLDRARCLIASGRRPEAQEPLQFALRLIEQDRALETLLDEAVQLEPTLLAAGPG